MAIRIEARGFIVCDECDDKLLASASSATRIANILQLATDIQTDLELLAADNDWFISHVGSYYCHKCWPNMIEETAGYQYDDASIDN